MPIGTSDGEYFDDHYDYAVRRPVINPDEDPRFMTHDDNVVTPNQMGINQQMDQAEQDPTTGTGIPISNRIQIFRDPVDSTMPPQASEKPADALKSDEGSQTPAKSAVTNFFDRLSIVNPVKAMFAGPNLAEDKALVTGLYESVKNAFKLPGDVYGGKIDPMSPQGIERAFDLATLSVLGPAPVAAKMADGTLGSFIGVRARTFDKNKLAEAQVMEKAGASADDIWEKTGTFKGADGRWRQEINDSKATVDPKAFVMREAEHIGPGGKKATQEFGPSLEDVLDHPELFKAHPSLRFIELQPFPKGQYGRAAYDSSSDTIQLGKNFKVEDVLHEVQHAIQKREGFAPGGSPAEQFALRFEEDLRIAKIEANQLLEYRNSDRFKGWTKEDEGRIQQLKRLFEVDSLRKGISAAEAEAQYMRLAGEVEARNVETRSAVSKATTDFIPPWMTEDTARNLQTVTDKPMWTTPYGPTLNPMVAPDSPLRKIVDDFSPQRAPPRDFRRAANDNPTPAQQEEARKLRKAIRREESDKAFAELQKLNKELEDKIARRPKPERAKEIRETLSGMRGILENRDWTEIELAKYNKLSKEMYGEDYTPMPFKMDE